MTLWLIFVCSAQLALFWCIARYCLGVSPLYAFQCAYLELRVQIAWWRHGSGKTGEKRGVSQGTCATRAKTGPDAVRGVQVVNDADYRQNCQTIPPTKRVSTLFNAAPCGQEISYSDCVSKRTRLTPDSEDSDAWQHRLECLRQGAEVHRQVRQYVQKKLRPTMTTIEVVDLVEKTASNLVGFDAKNPLARGWAFPCGLSLNEVAAHDTVNPGDIPRRLQVTDLAKIDFGVQIDGHILDCAFSFTFCDMHEELMRAVREATETGIKHAGPDALVSEVGGLIQEVMESSEAHTPDGKVIPIYSIKNLTGHSIGPYKIHNGKGLPSVKTGGGQRMLQGELWAVETFGSAGGVGYVCNRPGSSHFMRPTGGPLSKIQCKMLSKQASALLELVDRRFGTLAFCPRWIVQEAQMMSAKCRDDLFARGSRARNPQESVHLWWERPLSELCNIGVVNRYPPLADLPGSYTAQYEHTILLKSNGKEVLTRGSDY